MDKITKNVLAGKSVREVVLSEVDMDGIDVPDYMPLAIVKREFKKDNPEVGDSIEIDNIPEGKSKLTITKIDGDKVYLKQEAV